MYTGCVGHFPPGPAGLSSIPFGGGKKDWEDDIYRWRVSYRQHAFSSRALLHNSFLIFLWMQPQAIRTALDENAQKIVPIHSPQFGQAIAVCVGAMMVGSIQTTVDEGEYVVFLFE